jgi:uncharacterized protein
MCCRKALQARKMIDPEKVAFDIDGVIANTMQLFLDIAREVYGINHIRYADITQYHLDECLAMDPDVIREINNRIIEGDYPFTLAPIEGAGEVLRRLGHYGPLRLVTARPKPGPMADWMPQLLLPERHQIDLHATGSFEAKADVLKAHNVRFFVEDRLDTCFLLAAQEITPVLFVQPWNREKHPFIEVHNWEELHGLFNFY